MKIEILNFVNSNTDRSTMDTLSTKEIAVAFNIPTNKAYSILKSLSDSKQITYMEPQNRNNLGCADWVKN